MSSETYAYKGISAGKYVEGNIDALNQEEASFKLKEQKIIITNLVRTKKKVEKEAKKKSKGFSFGKQKVKPADVVVFSKQFATIECFVPSPLNPFQIIGGTVTKQ